MLQSHSMNGSYRQGFRAAGGLKSRLAGLALLVIVAGAGRSVASAATFQSLGLAVTPAHFPRHSSKDVEDMFRLGKQAGNVAVFIYQWGQPGFKDVASKTVQAAKNAGLTPVLALSPTRLDRKSVV